MKQKPSKSAQKRDPTAFVGVVRPPSEVAAPPLETEREEAFLIVTRGPNKGAEFALRGDFRGREHAHQCVASRCGPLIIPIIP